MSRSRLARAAAGLALACAALATACVHQTLPVTEGQASQAGIAPQLAVERFLRAANCVASNNCATKTEDIETMGKLFGTHDGSILKRDPRGDVEKRMFALASLLQSDDYKVQGQNIVPGRLGQAVLLNVRIKQGGREYQLPVTVVRSGSGDWLVEKIDLKPLTQNQ